MVLLRLNLRLKLVLVAKFCSSDVTTGAQMPAGDSNAAVFLEKERERLVSFVTEGTKARDVLTMENGVVIPP